MRKHLVMGLVIVGGLAAVGSAEAQPLGTFRWQQEPYCNVITLNVVQSDGVFQLDGFDDECGAPMRSAVIGTAFQNPDGSIGMGLTVVTAGGLSFPLDATLALSSLSGTWRSSAYPSGAWLYTPGPGHPGSPRPAPTATIVESAGLNLPAPLEAQSSITSLNETVVTPRTARLSIHKNVGAVSMSCSNASTNGFVFITLDGVPIRNSVVFTSTSVSGVLIGVTSSPVLAGSHVIGVGLRCFSGTLTGLGYGIASISTVRVLP
jgi:hypothetical protein